VSLTVSLDLSSLAKAIIALERGLNTYIQRFDEELSISEKELLRAGVLKFFESTLKLCWKYMKRWLEANLSPDITNGLNRQKFFKICAENLFIDNVNKWMKFYQARNVASFNYDENIANEVLTIAKKFFPYAKICLKRLEERI
jgi:nucleotidyltransferase substrate binding protein (TIGR01987 family)